jgi:hypothetical protein
MCFHFHLYHPHPQCHNTAYHHLHCWGNPSNVPHESGHWIHFEVNMTIQDRSINHQLKLWFPKALTASGSIYSWAMFYRLDLQSFLLGRYQKIHVNRSRSEWHHNRRQNSNEYIFLCIVRSIRDTAVAHRFSYKNILIHSDPTARRKFWH